MLCRLRDSDAYFLNAWFSGAEVIVVDDEFELVIHGHGAVSSSGLIGIDPEYKVVHLEECCASLAVYLLASPYQGQAFRVSAFWVLC